LTGFEQAVQVVCQRGAQILFTALAGNEVPGRFAEALEKASGRTILAGNAIGTRKMVRLVKSSDAGEPRGGDAPAFFRCARRGFEIRVQGRHDTCQEIGLVGVVLEKRAGEFAEKRRVFLLAAKILGAQVVEVRCDRPVRFG